MFYLNNIRHTPLLIENYFMYLLIHFTTSSMPLPQYSYIYFFHPHVYTLTTKLHYKHAKLHSDKKDTKQCTLCLKNHISFITFFRIYPAYYPDIYLLSHVSDTPALSCNTTEIPEPVRFQARVLQS